MSPFRELPPVELGPLDVGLEDAAREASARIPSGGRLFAETSAVLALHTAGALGSAGLLLVGSAAFVAWLLGWTPRSGQDVLLCIGGVIAGGTSLAAILRAIDRRDARATHSGEVVGRAARRAVDRLAKLSSCARAAPDAFGPRRVAALRRAIHAVNSPEIARWVPEDLRGRAELLLARSIAAQGPRWMKDTRQRAEVARLLVDAASRLVDPRPAATDLGLVKRRLAHRAPPSAAHFAAVAPHGLDDEDACEERPPGTMAADASKRPGC